MTTNTTRTTPDQDGTGLNHSETRREQSPRSGNDERHALHCRILHTSDWQLGMPTNYLGADAKARFADARLSAVERVFALAEEQQCDAIVVAGDVFDSNLLQPEVYQRALNVLRTAPIPVFLLPGNHDPYDPASVYRKREFAELAEAAHGGAQVAVLSDTDAYELETDGGVTLSILGAPLLTRHPNRDLVADAVAALRKNEGPAGSAEIRVLVGHGNVEAFGDADDLSCIDTDMATQACRDRIVDYVALGDTHSAMPLNEDKTMWYSGAPEVTAFREPHGGGESNSGKALVVEISVDDADPTQPATVTVTEHSVGQWRFQALEAEVNSRDDAENFIQTLSDWPQPRTSVVKYKLIGSVDLATFAWLE